MTMMMYRGFAHDGRQQRALPAPQYLIYRGVRHDGLRGQQIHVRYDVQLCYRGHWHHAADTITTALVDAGAVTGQDGVSWARDAIAA